MKDADDLLGDRLRKIETVTELLRAYANLTWQAALPLIVVLAVIGAYRFVFAVSKGCP